jgi:hypothetical protein
MVIEVMTTDILGQFLLGPVAWRFMGVNGTGIDKWRLRLPGTRRPNADPRRKPPSGGLTCMAPGVIS